MQWLGGNNCLNGSTDTQQLLPVFLSFFLKGDSCPQEYIYICSVLHSIKFCGLLNIAILQE